jgi:protein-L-isoaspartate(D-aspartate) O-methyltransferase
MSVEDKKLFYSKVQLLFELYERGYLKDIRLFKAFLEVELSQFVPEEAIKLLKSIYPRFKIEQIYRDNPILFYNQENHPEKVRTISAKHMISIMIQNLILNKNDDLLILGAKSGYIAVLAHHLASQGKIIILEANSEIAKITLNNIKKLNLDDKIQVIVKNPLDGMPQLAPWKKILVTGAIKQNRLNQLLRQLDKDYGVLFAPVGEDLISMYTQFIRVNNDYFAKKHLQVRFTPLITRVEYDELKLITDAEELKRVENFTAISDIAKEKPKKKPIIIKYTDDILNELNLEPKKRESLFEIKPNNVFKAFLENVNNTIDSLKNKEDLHYWSNTVENFELVLSLIKKLKKNIKINTRKIGMSINQIKTYNLIRQEIEKQQSYDIDLKNDELKEIINKQLNELEKLQIIVRKEIKSIKGN